MLLAIARKTMKSAVLAFALVALCSCDGGRPSGEAGERNSRSQVLRATSFKYNYGGQFGRFDIADEAEAYNGNTLVGRARAIELQDSQTGGPRVLKIEVTHFSASGAAAYKGYVYIQAGFGGGRLVREEDISGQRQSTVFGTWQFGK